MTLAIPTPAALAKRFAAALATKSFTASDGSTVTLDANAPGSLEQILSVICAIDEYAVYNYMRAWALEFMVTTATETGLLPDHAEMWGVSRISATYGSGSVEITTTDAVSLAAGTLLTIDGTVQWAVDSSVTLSSGTTTAVAVTATTSGTDGNVDAGTALSLVSTVAGISTIVVGSDGLTGGAAIEAVETWRARIIDEIRDPNGGGTEADYEKWAKAAGAAYVAVIKDWVGSGTVGICVAMTGGTAPSATEIATIQAYIDGKRPIRGNAFVFAATIVAQNPTILLNPDSTTARTKVETALAAYYLSLGIAGTIYKEQIEDEIISVNGANNTLVSPTANVTLADNALAVLGTITWETTS